MLMQKEQEIAGEIYARVSHVRLECHARIDRRCDCPPETHAAPETDIHYTSAAFLLLVGSPLWHLVIVALQTMTPVEARVVL